MIINEILKNNYKFIILIIKDYYYINIFKIIDNIY